MVNSSQNIKNKLFEYLVFLLEQWKNDIQATGSFTKLRLQKILFFAVAVNATEENHPLLNVFNRFYAMPYGPVELDIYESMKRNEFDYIKFNGIECQPHFQKNTISHL